VNLFVVRKADIHNKTDLELVKLFKDAAVQKAFKKDYPAAVASDTSAADLQAELTQVEQDAKAAAAAK
jgi:D-methionine transport system substrate-binding protein